jgi:hypothetical protein
VLWLGFFWNISDHSKRAARDIVRKAFISVPIGASTTEAISALKPFAIGQGFKVMQSDSTRGVVQLMTPPELGTANWVLSLDLQHGRVQGKSIRVLEGNYRPCEAPADEGFPISPPDRLNGADCIR